ncbi:STAS domain-containing protein [Rubripirellula reticaptiva]|uniref:STAS domain protein n=1 Tax=Rubripirellula reticaptiva TaxID=2528013 RepID=A0A5C6EN53_9BACT|nr:STAS domain-containing protein [Rubripirellula reticaptiva]TWU49794.1 STAS domain protein [Rubripirellula reticaptiva]
MEGNGKTRIERHGAITAIRPTGPLRVDGLERLNQNVQAVLVGGIPNVVVDLSETPLIDGAGLEWILSLDETCCRRGGCVRLCGANELCSDILRITGVGKIVQKFHDLTAALGSFA